MSKTASPAPDEQTGASDPLAPLAIFKSIEVGPAVLRPDRITAPIRIVTADGREAGTDLIYTWEEPVFTPSEPESQNLAAVIAAQVAINYGLFADRLVFHGPLDATDRRLIAEMTENTAREIYVKKFLEPNPFLRGDAARLPVVRRRRYRRATLDFPDAVAGGWRLWETAKNRHAVLSSGGKDSLLSYGLLDETGCEVHPIFINESGRHWFTALNAYRHFKENIATTSRVWVNTDRIFAWMLKQMPFVRKDFAGVRSDEYPIRLWTVAVFLFGALPLLRKRGIGRILIGNEYDTTVRAAHEGISHFNGLYDQSIYFDTALSRYFMRKGWSVSQFSVLRPLSELLIEKILVTRYPHLQAHQVSCHAAHKAEERIRPCGRCEKCRRIVGMLTAVGADPHRCGYTDDQIHRCLSELTGRGVSQEAAGADHMAFLLAEKGVLPLKTTRPHPEVLKVRVHPLNSPLDSIPVDLRRPLLSLFMAHAEGAIRYEKRRWNNFDPLASPGIDAPYAFELTGSPEAVGKSSPDGVLWQELSWPEAEKRLEQVDVALLPVGAVEQHGPHLPLDTDAFDAEYLAVRVAKACSEPKPLVLPAIAYGVSYHHQDFPGTLSIRNETLAQMVYEIGMDAARNGIRKLVVINGHGGNGPALKFPAQMTNRDARIFVCVDSGETSDVDIYGLVETPNDVHAGEIETSTALAVRPQLVRMDLAVREVPAFSNRYLDFTSKRGISWYAYTRRISASGIMGDPTAATAEKGEKIWAMMIAHLVSLVEDIKVMTLAEIHQR